jgi:hypothetical protein
VEAHHVTVWVGEEGDEAVLADREFVFYQLAAGCLHAAGLYGTVFAGKVN